ncbi:acyl-CoA dehydrogenase family protein [Amycolatopsis thermophila]|uniref:Alkylation response protein AidB-like acyl-CoA dehydrogenase n=1 Tax=Amycolatopsis thermophila TaxID=206084 RepID=A0ABU0F1A5_9PSEU|nr:acyl-CoA dehydrogenase family protein [Amycolatopsis thermophila]MDQ0381364.1 alkylation response protein AidB-like acyl-CoA dehydrogenase [Amycolatopsis thermophila]
MTVADDLAGLRTEVRTLIAKWDFTPRCDAWLRGHDESFSRALAEHGWIGMTWPAGLGGSDRSNLARLVVTEELLRAGAPVAAHWMGDRQIGPAILRTGSPDLQRRYLPRIAAGEVTFCLGMSETESGSDLASVRTVAEPAEGGWRVRGRKIWTSHAHRATHAYVLARTGSGGGKHEGLTEFIVDMAADGVQVRPIHDLRGDHHFNEVTFDDVFVPAGDVLGTVGDGWRQVTEQLAFERGGMERVLSTYPLLEAVLAAPGAAGHAAAIGTALARLATLRRLAWRVALALDTGEAPVHQAAMLKDLGTTFEGDVNELAREVLAIEPDPAASGAAGLLAEGVLAAPGFTIRGGTTEVLRVIIARGATGPRQHDDSGLRAVADDVLAGHGGDPDPEPGPVWTELTGLGWPGAGTPEELGGSGGDLADLAELVEACGRNTVSTPLAETGWARLLLAASGQALPEGAATVIATGAGLRLEGDRLSGTAVRVPWARAARWFVIAVGEELVTVEAAAPGIDIEPGANLAAEPRDTVRFDGVPAAARTPCRGDVLGLGGLLRAAAITGALETAVAHTVAHVTTRHQFGRPLRSFQAVGMTLARMASQHTLARTAVETAVAASRESIDLPRVAAAMVIAAEAATEVARGAHQLHGAMGVTREHPLHLATRRLWSWRDELGGPRSWADLLGTRLLELGPDGIWDWITADIEEEP